MTTLVSGLQATNIILQEAPDISLNEAVQRGASAELLSSIEEMGDHPGLRALDMSFRWSPTQPPPPASIPSQVIVPRPQKDRVQAVRKSMLNLKAIPQDQVVGHVVRLERSEGREEGTVVIDGYIGRTRHNVKVQLEGQEYQLAIRAHQTRQAIVASGTITREKRSWWLTGKVSIGLPLK
jgi:hypothetical protein